MAGTDPKVSVLMPVFNAEPYLAEAVESILAQSFIDFELIIVNDGSTDGTPALLEQFATRNSRIRVIDNGNNLGIVSSLNRGLDACRGAYVARMDADDIAVLDRLAKQVAVMDAKPDIVALGGALEYIDSAGRDLGVVRQSGTAKSTLSQTPILHPTAMIRRSSLVENHINYEERYRYAEDYFLWMQLSRLGRIEAIDDVVLRYRVSSGATRVKHVKGVLWATLKAKKAGVFSLGIRPGLGDIARFFGECVLLCLPSRFVLWLYFKLTFNGKVKVLK